MKELPDLSGFNASDEVYRHWTGMLYTQGIDYLAKTCGAFWLLDLVGIAQAKKEVKAEAFQIWTLTVKNHSALVTCKGDTSWPVVYRQNIGCTDFPEGELKMYFENGTLLLPNER